jgi:hypothetical protein
MNKAKRFFEKLKNNKSENGSMAPYLGAWLLGVPGSILVVIFLLRGCR